MALGFPPLGVGKISGSSGGSGNLSPPDVTDFANGFELPGNTFSGGPTVVADYQGTLVTSPADVLPIEGMRLATTVAEGAELGPELVGSINTSGAVSFDAGSRTLIAVRISGTGDRATLSGLSASKTYLISFSPPPLSVDGYAYFPAQLRDAAVASTILTLDTPGVTFSGQAGISILQSANGRGCQYNNLSIREVIPTWLPTTSLGAPIHPSTPLRTRKGTVSVYDEAYKGPLIEPARTNKVTCRKSNPTDTTNFTKTSDASVLSVVDDTAALAAAGLSDICTSGKVYKLDNSGGSATARAFSSPTGNTNAHSSGVYVRGGSGFLSLAGATAGKAVFGVSASYQYIKQENYTPSGVDWTWSMVADAGQIVYFILPQLEEGAFATSPIASDSTGADPLTALTRPAANLTRPTAGTALASGNDFAVYGRVVPKAAGQGIAFLCSSYVDSLNWYGVYTNSTGSSLTLAKNINGAVTYFLMSYAPSADTPFEYLAYQHSVHGMGIAVRSWNDSVWSAWSAWATNADTQNAPIAATYQIGARNNANHFAGNYPFTEIISIPASVNPQSWLMDQLSKGRI